MRKVLTNDGASSHPPVIELNQPLHPIDLSGGYDREKIIRLMPAVGGYEEERSPAMYDGPLFNDGRTLHMGIDFWVPDGTPVLAVASGRVFGLADNRGPKDYGPTIITEHEINRRTVWMLYGHLSAASLARIETGRQIAPGDVIGFVGMESENGGWVPHLHVQLATERPKRIDLPGVVLSRDREQAKRLYPDPRLILGPVY